MTLHDRLKPVPFDDEGPPRPAWHAIALSAVIALVAAGMALALPYAVRRATIRPAGKTVVEASPRATAPMVLPGGEVEGDDDERKGPKKKRSGRAKGRHSTPVGPANPRASEVHANRQGDGRGDKNDDAGDGRSDDQDDESDDGKNDDDGDDGDEREQDLPDEEDKNGKAPDHAGGPDDPDDDPGSSDGGDKEDD